MSCMTKANKCIECTVSQCAHHCNAENYCSLDKIMIGTHEMNPTVDPVHRLPCLSRRSKHCAKEKLPCISVKIQGSLSVYWRWVMGT